MKQYFSHRMKFILVMLAGVVLFACGTQDNAQSGDNMQQPEAVYELQVYKHLKCRCCKKWMNRLEQFNFELDSTNLYDISDIKDEHNIPANLRSCHTSISPDGFIFEGHIPAKFIAQYLANPPQDSRGLSVPAMPVGSPGMEVGDRFQPYHIVQLNNDGSTDIYATVNTYEEQF